MSLRSVLVPAFTGVLFLGLFGGGPARGGFGKSSIIDSKLRGLARRLADVPLDRKEKAVALGKIAGPADAPGGALLQCLIARHLAGFGIAVDRDAEVFVNGKYTLQGDLSRLDRVEVKIELTVRDVTHGKTLKTLEETINQRGNDDLVALLGLNADFQRREKGGNEDRNEFLADLIGKSPLVLDGTKVRTRKDSRFWVEVLSAGKNGQKAYGVTEVKGRAFVEMQEGDLFAVRLHNGMKTDAAAVLLLDGVPLDQFDEPQDKAADAAHIGPGQTRDIAVWPLGGGKSERFRAGKLRALPKADFLRPDEKVGTITVMFYPAWEKTPPAEFEGPRCGAGTPTRLDSGGKMLKWFSGQLLEAVTLRYKKE